MMCNMPVKHRRIGHQPAHSLAILNRGGGSRKSNCTSRCHHSQFCHLRFFQRFCGSAIAVEFGLIDPASTQHQRINHRCIIHHRIC